MVEEQGLDDLDLVLAKMDHIAEFEKPRIAEPMDLVMVMAADGQDFYLRMGAPDGGCVRGMRQLGMADPQIVQLAAVQKVRKRLQHRLVLPGAQRVDQERLLVKEQVGAVDDVVRGWIQRRIDLGEFGGEAAIVVLGAFADAVADPIDLRCDLPHADAARPFAINTFVHLQISSMTSVKRCLHWPRLPRIALPWVGAMTLTSRFENTRSKSATTFAPDDSLRKRNAAS